MAKLKRWQTMRHLIRGVIAGAFIMLASPAANADESGPGASPLTTLVCRDREYPDVGATLVFNLARRRLIDSSGTGGTILFGDGSIPLKMSPAAIEWEAGGNTFWLNRATLELNVINRVFFCQIARNQL